MTEWRLGRKQTYVVAGRTSGSKHAVTTADLWAGVALGLAPISAHVGRNLGRRNVAAVVDARREGVGAVLSRHDGRSGEEEGRVQHGELGELWRE
jgi:hypothetical protein